MFEESHGIIPKPTTRFKVYQLNQQETIEKSDEMELGE